jgi:hypothetical protein
MSVWNRLLSALTGKVAQAVANLSGALALVSIAIVAIYSIQDWITAVFLQLMFSILSVILSAGTIFYIYKRIYRKISNRDFQITGARVSYRKRLIYAIRLGYIEDNYFMSMIWIKLTRVIIMAIVGSFLSVSYISNPHVHKASFVIFGQTIYTHAILDSVMLLSIAALLAAVLMNLHEINVIAHGVSRLRIRDYWRSRRRRRLS